MKCEDKVWMGQWRVVQTGYNGDLHPGKEEGLCINSSVPIDLLRTFPGEVYVDLPDISGDLTSKLCW